MSSKSHFFRQSGLNLTLVAQYDFNNNLIDSIGGNNGTGTDITFNSGSFGNEAVFNGSNSFVEIADNDAFTFTDGVDDLPFRIELTLRLESNVQQYIINKRGVPGTFEWQLIQNFNTFQVALGNGSASSILSSSVAFTYVQGNYYNVIIEYNASKTQNGLRIRVDGVKDTPDPNNPIYLGMSNTSSDVTIGRSGQTSNRYLNGAISQIKVFK